MKVRVDATKCVGHGRCYVLAPDVFEVDVAVVTVVFVNECRPVTLQRALDVADVGNQNVIAFVAD